MRILITDILRLVTEHSGSVFDSTLFKNFRAFLPTLNKHVTADTSLTDQGLFLLASELQKVLDDESFRKQTEEKLNQKGSGRLILSLAQMLGYDLLQQVGYLRESRRLTLDHFNQAVTRVETARAAYQAWQASLISTVDGLLNPILTQYHATQRAMGEQNQHLRAMEGQLHDLRNTFRTKQAYERGGQKQVGVTIGYEDMGGGSDAWKYRDQPVEYPLYAPFEEKDRIAARKAREEAGRQLTSHEEKMTEVRVRIQQLRDQGEIEYAQMGQLSQVKTDCSNAEKNYHQHAHFSRCCLVLEKCHQQVEKYLVPHEQHRETLRVLGEKRTDFNGKVRAHLDEKQEVNQRVTGAGVSMLAVPAETHGAAAGAGAVAEGVPSVEEPMASAPDAPVTVLPMAAAVSAVAEGVPSVQGPVASAPAAAALVWEQEEQPGAPVLSGSADSARGAGAGVEGLIEESQALRARNFAGGLVQYAGPRVPHAAPGAAPLQLPAPSAPIIVMS